MTTQTDANVTILPEPIKAVSDKRYTAEEVSAQFDVAAHNLIPVDYKQVRGTCGDERRRIGLLNGETTVTPRPSVFGGPNIYGLAIAELSDVLPNELATAAARLHYVTGLLNEGGVRSGGHAKCAANAGIATWMTTIASGVPAVRDYARSQLGEEYDDSTMDAVVASAKQLTDSGMYDMWGEQALIDELGDDAGDAIETLEDKPHEAVTFVRQKRDGYTIDQTPVCDQSIIGVGTFVHDDAYAESIESIVIGGSDAEHKKKVARHAREAILAAVAGVVPNEILYQANIG